jgi:hypothetical protein
MYILWICGDSGDNNIQYSTTNYISHNHKHTHMDITVEEITPTSISELTREEAQVLYQEYGSLQGKIQTAMDLLKRKIWGDEPKIVGCQSCGSKQIRFRKNGTYFCTKCGYSSGDP